MRKTIVSILLSAIAVSSCKTNENVSPKPGTPVNNHTPFSVTTYSYNQAGNVISSTTTNPAGMNGNGGSSIYTYDAQGRLSYVLNSNDGRKASETKYSYNDQGMVVNQTNIRYAIPDETNILSNSYSYDNKGRIIAINQGKTTKNCIYNNKGLLEEIHMPGLRQLCSYDGEGQLVNVLIIQHSDAGVYTDSVVYSGYRNGRPSARKHFYKSGGGSLSAKYYLSESNNYTYDQYMNLIEEKYTSFFSFYSYRYVYSYNLNLFAASWLATVNILSGNDPNRFTRDVNRNKVLRIERYGKPVSLTN